MSAFNGPSRSSGSRPIARPTLWLGRDPATAIETDADPVTTSCQPGDRQPCAPGALSLAVTANAALSPDSTPLEGLASTVPQPNLPPRRRIYLMRHGSVDYFRADGSPVPPQGVPLNTSGREQADAAGRAFAAAGARFDKVLTSGLPRTVETAQRVLLAAGSSTEIQHDRLDSIARDDLPRAFNAVFSTEGDVEAHRFLGGESIGELLDRILPAFDELLRDGRWHDLLLVLHGGVNRALLARAITGGRAFFGRIEQAPACINIIDVGANDMVLRGINIAPTQWLHPGDRLTSMEMLLAQYLRQGDQAS